MGGGALSIETWARWGVGGGGWHLTFGRGKRGRGAEWMQLFEKIGFGPISLPPPPPPPPPMHNPKKRLEETFQKKLASSSRTSQI
jgi:hypothetical protein